MSVEVGVEEFIVDVSVVDAEVAVSVVEAIVEVNVSGTPGPSVVSTDAGNTAVLGSDFLIFVPTPPPSGMDQATADARYLQLVGGILTGPLTLDDPEGGVGSLGLSGTGLVLDSASGPGSYVSIRTNGGEQMWADDTGGYVRSSPSMPNGIATKAYVDAQIWKGTQAEYDALGWHEPEILYVVTG